MIEQPPSPTPGHAWPETTPPPPSPTRPPPRDAVSVGLPGPAEESRRSQRRQDRLARRALAASPELLTLWVGSFTLLVWVFEGDAAAIVVSSTVLGIFAWVFLAKGDTLVSCLLLLAIGTLAATVVGASVSPEPDRLWWVMPGLVIVVAEAAMTYNHLRRRQGDISRRVTRMNVENLVLVSAAAIALAWMLQRLTQADGQVQWPWFATTVVVLAAAAIIGLGTIRRRALPADRRRFSPGRRVLPPPR